MARLGSRWSRAEDNMLRHLRAQGMCSAAIAAEIGRSFHSVKSRVNRLGLGAERPKGCFKFSMSMTHDIIERLRRHTSKRGMLMSPYVRQLIEKDLELAA
jgi:hypothetical protein